jgi:hypothetical protein
LCDDKQRLCFAQLLFLDLGGGSAGSSMGSVTPRTSATATICARGFYLDEPPWRAHVFLLTQPDVERSR